MRNFFKSTYIHSTTNLSNKSQIEFQERFETSLENNAKSDILMYNTDNHEIKGSHDGYCSKNLTLFERTISFGNQITINDCRLSDNYNNLPMNTNFIIPENVEIKNIGGFYGSVISDFLLQSIGLIAFMIVFNFEMLDINFWRY